MAVQSLVWAIIGDPLWGRFQLGADDLIVLPLAAVFAATGIFAWRNRRSAWTWWEKSLHDLTDVIAAL